MTSQEQAAARAQVAVAGFDLDDLLQVAWDLAYLTVPWPTCWCSWQLPSWTRERAVQAYLAGTDGDA